MLRRELYLWSFAKKLYHGWISTMTPANEISWKLPLLQMKSLLRPWPDRSWWRDNRMTAKTCPYSTTKQWITTTGSNEEAEEFEATSKREHADVYNEVEESDKKIEEPPKSLRFEQISLHWVVVALKIFFRSEIVTIAMSAMKFRKGTIDLVFHNSVPLSFFPHLHFKIWRAKWHELLRFLWEKQD